MDGSKLEAVNNRDKTFSKGKIASCLAHLEAEVERYLEEADRIDRQETGAARTERAAHLTSRFHRVRHEIERLTAMDKALVDAPDGQISPTDSDARAMAIRAQHSGQVGYNFQSVVDAETHSLRSVWTAALNAPFAGPSSQFRVRSEASLPDQSSAAV